MPQHYQDKQISTNNELRAKVRLMEIGAAKQDDRIRELEFAVQKLLKTVFGIEPKYKFVLMNEGEKDEQQ